MNLDEKISKSLEKHTKWSGNPSAMWAVIEGEIDKDQKSQKKNPWWKAQPLALGSVVAATVLMVIWIQNILTPLPPVQPEVQMAPQLRSFAVQFDPSEPLSVSPGEEVIIICELGPQTNLTTPTTLDVTDLESGMLVDQEEIELVSQAFTAFAPLLPGHYRITVEGTVSVDGQRHIVQGEQELIVQERKDDSNVQEDL